MKKTYISLILAGLLIFAVFGAALANESTPSVIPFDEDLYGELSARWWQWAFSFPAEDIPFFNTGGPVDISAGQSGQVWFLAGVGGGLGAVERSGVIPKERYLFFPLGNLINDYPCPPEFGFEPSEGETLEEFLQRTGNEFLDYYWPKPSKLFAEIDGEPLEDLQTYRTTSDMFMFQADPSLNTWFDPCITGTPQPGVSVGYWLLLPPLTPGTHTLHFGITSKLAPQDITYELTVTRGD